MSASLASAMMNARERGLALISASLASSDFIWEIRNPNVEVRKNSEIRSPNNAVPIESRLRNSGFGLRSDFGFRYSDLSHLHLCQGVLEGAGGVLQGHGFFGPKLDLDVPLHTAAADHAGHTQTNVPDIIDPLNEGRDRQERLLVRQHGVDDITNGDTDGPTGAALAFDDFRAAALGAFEDRVLKSRSALGQPGQRQAVDGGARPDGHHRVAVFTEDEGFYLSGRQLEFVSDQRAKAGSVE